METVLVVDDSNVDRHLAGKLLQKRRGLLGQSEPTNLSLLFAANGKEALSILERNTLDAVVTDLQMPEMNGLELVKEMQVRHPSVPVVLMTAHGSEEIALEALQLGAASYVPKRKLAHELLETVENVLQTVRTDRHHRRLLECMTHWKSQFSLENDLYYVAPLVAHLEEAAVMMKLWDQNEVIRVGIALREAVINAMHHGNLEVSSELREKDESSYFELARQRQHEEPYCSRRVFVEAEVSPEEAVYVVRDEGCGFDPAQLPDPMDPANLHKPSGRGLLLIRTFMDEVSFNEHGNEVRLGKRRGRGG